MIGNHAASAKEGIRHTITTEDGNEKHSTSRRTNEIEDTKLVNQLLRLFHYVRNESLKLLSLFLL